MMTPSDKNILLCAGGTGGHLFPAEALARELASRGWTVYLATDSRAIKFTENFPATTTHILNSATFSSRNPFSMLSALFRLAHGYFTSLILFRRHKIRIVIGFGGYPTLPPVLAASHIGIKTIIHEQNARMGRANRFLSRRVTKIAGGFTLPDTPSNFTLTGNPLRQSVHDASRIAYPIRKKTDNFNLLVFGGSQGAQFFTDILPATLSKLATSYSSRINLTLQAPSELASTLSPNVLTTDIAPFFSDMPQRIATSHLVICRSGAGSVCELSRIGRPSILVPLPNSLDDDQGINASFLSDAGGAVLIRQHDLTPDKLSVLLMNALDNPDALVTQSENVKKVGVKDATVTLANLVDSLFPAMES